MTGWRPISRRSMLALGAAAVAGAGLSGRAAADPGDPLAAAVQAYIFGYPLVLMDVTREASVKHLPLNRLANVAATPTPDSTYVVRPNLDTLYSQAWLDLRTEPVMMQVPAMSDGRYWLMQVLDMWTNSEHDPSSIAPLGAPPYTYAITGPGWTGSLPAGVTQLPMKTATAWLLGRIQVDGPADLAAVHDIQQQLRLSPLSSWGAAGPGTSIAGLGNLGGGPRPPDVVAGMDADTFFRRLCAVMGDNPPAADDAPVLERFASIGITPGRYTATVSGGILDRALEVAKAQIKAALLGQVLVGAENRWFTPEVVGVYGTDYLARATIAQVGLGANLRRDAIYLNTQALTAGPLKRYRLHFAPGQLPPNDAFWSLTAYTNDSYLVPNAAGIYAVGPGVVTNPDGSVDLAVQADDPGPAVPQGNWLPIPAAGMFSLTMRVYAPKSEALDGRWQPPALTPLL
ncbi:DUF1254 domain-containing protein [Nocardia sp. XZ_19_385]|uniref:DUF1254 domain-containing protein n=1 Tax=Nocardia sp. XZ_19_385 TaxID=2769488 RepID=UPI0018909BAC|nr:DUF1254 domain-containing protein [Nocardia sp. XZ_19_385]